MFQVAEHFISRDDDEEGTEGKKEKQKGGGGEKKGAKKNKPDINMAGRTVWLNSQTE